MRETCAHVTTESNPGSDTPAGLALVSLQTLDVRRSLQQVVSLCVDFARMIDAGLGSVLRSGGRPQPLSWPYVRPVAVERRRGCTARSSRFSSRGVASAS